MYIYIYSMCLCITLKSLRFNSCDFIFWKERSVDGSNLTNWHQLKRVVGKHCKPVAWPFKTGSNGETLGKRWSYIAANFHKFYIVYHIVTLVPNVVLLSRNLAWRGNSLTRRCADAQMLYLVFAEATNFNHSLSIDWVCHAYYVYTRACII